MNLWMRWSATFLVSGGMFVSAVHAQTSSEAPSAPATPASEAPSDTQPPVTPVTSAAQTPATTVSADPPSTPAVSSSPSLEASEVEDRIPYRFTAQTRIWSCIAPTPAASSVAWVAGDRIPATSENERATLARREATRAAVYGSAPFPVPTTAEAGMQFYVVRQTDTVAMIRFYPWDCTTNHCVVRNALYADDQRTFCVDHTEGSSNSARARRQYASFSAGALTVPVRLRMGYGDASFETEAGLNIAASARVYWHVGRQGLSTFGFVAFTGVTNVKFDYTPETPADEEPAEEIEIERAAFSIGCGPVFSVSAVDFALLAGFDFVTKPDNPANDVWEHNRHLWFGLSIGGRLIEVEGSSNEND